MGPAGPVSGQPWSTPSGDPLSVEPYQPPPPPAQPTFKPGYASLPSRPSAPDPYAPTSQFPAQSGYVPPGYEPPDYGQPGYAPPGYGPPPGYEGQPGYGPPAPRKSNVPLVAVIVAVAVLLCGGAVTAGTLVVSNVADRAKEAVKPITDPTLPPIPTEAPDLPGLPTDLPTLPTDLPNLPGGTGKKITVRYEVTGDGPAEILYTKKLGETPHRVNNAKLPWKITTKMEGTAFVSVTAVRSGADSGSISCRATVDGEEVAQRTREGGYATVSCNKLIIG